MPTLRTHEGRKVTRLGLALWLLAVIALALAATHAHRQAQQPRQCPPECSDCGHSWASSKPVCTPKNMKGMK